MTQFKTTLNVTASSLRLLSKAVQNWPWVLLIICILSPISPHIRIPYALSYSECDYMGTRGAIAKIDNRDCPLIAIIDTRTRKRLSW